MKILAKFQELRRGVLRQRNQKETSTLPSKQGSKGVVPEESEPTPKVDERTLKIEQNAPLQETHREPGVLEFEDLSDSWLDNFEFEEDDYDGEDSISLPDSCFSQVATVEVLDGRGTVPMRDLQTGDCVHVGNHQYQPIYGFGRRETAQMAHFLQIQTDHVSRPLEISNEHLVFLQGISAPVRADSLQVGTVLRAYHNGMEESATVTNISSVHRPGRFSPLTPQGTIVVDGIVASCYYVPQHETTQQELVVGGRFLSQHQLLHLALAPWRMVCRSMPYESTHTLITYYNEKGLSPYLSYCFGLAEWMYSLRGSGAMGRAFRSVMVCLLVLVWSMCLLLEALLRPLYDLRLTEKAD